MATFTDLSNPEFLESAAAELRKEVERIEARAKDLRKNPMEFAPNAEGFFSEACSNICGACCMCSPC
jgi:hypothetical protein